MALIAAIDQGTTSTRVCITRTDGKVVAQSQFEHAQHMPQKGWVEHCLLYTTPSPRDD